MNYGMAGSISVHTDQHDNYDYRVAVTGPRLVTYMLYLSSVTGGRTFFPSLGLSLPTVEGDAVFWFNIRSDGGFDSRNMHGGCPVLWGNKWIANKWVLWTEQMWRYTCHRNRGTHYTLGDLTTSV